MQWRSNADVQDALNLAQDVMRIDGDHASFNGRMAAVRQMVKEAGREQNGTRRMCICAALGMVASGQYPTADDVAWLVRDSSIGHPQHPSFDASLGNDDLS